MNKLSVNKFSSGFKFIFKGFEAIKSDKTLWKWALIPLVLDLILLIYVLASAFAAIGATVNWGLSFIFTSTTGFFYNLLYYPLYILFFISVGAIAIYSVYLIGSIIASPFNSMIAEKVLINRGLLKQQNFNFKRWLAMSLKMF
ncbi:MAG: hypothetical protein KDD40_06460, partial [Bdellovibrionales bacterium]|nr:hypothetical protein [Bdellovibrionales bacterium]